MGCMRMSRISSDKQGRLIEHFVSGSTARIAASIVGVNKSTAAYFYHRLRQIIAYELEKEGAEIFVGEIEVDESYFEGKRKGRRGRSEYESEGSRVKYLSVVLNRRQTNVLIPCKDTLIE